MIRILFSLVFLLGCLASSQQAHAAAASPAPACSKSGVRNSYAAAVAAVPESKPAAKDAAKKIAETPVKKENSSTVAQKSSSTPVIVASSNLKTQSGPVLVSHAFARSTTTLPTASAVSNEAGGRLARVTAYWSGEGDYYTGRGLSSTGIRLHGGHCAVDPRIIPYGSVVEIAGVGKYLAVDTGSAVISREAAREAGHNSLERAALVIDLYFEHERDGERFAASGPKYAAVTWQAPNSANRMTEDVRNLVAEGDWNRLRNKQL